MDAADWLATRSPRPADELSGLLALEAIDGGAFRAPAALGSPGRRFGGQVAALALAAAANTVTGARPHSLHAYFLRPADSSEPVLFQVDRIHDGRTFRRRRVTATQQGQPVLSLESSFTTDDSGPDDYPVMPAVPRPEDCPRLDRGLNPARSQPSPWAAIEARAVPGEAGLPLAVAPNIWFRLRPTAGTGAIPPEVVVAFLSDLAFAATSAGPTERHPQGRPGAKRVTSLDHSVWFHHQARPSGWLLYAKAIPAGGPLRGIVTGQIFNLDGTLVATVAQEVLLG